MAKRTLLDLYIAISQRRVSRRKVVEAVQVALMKDKMKGRPAAHVLGVALVYERAWLGLSWMAQEWVKLQVAAAFAQKESPLARSEFEQAKGLVADDLGDIADGLWLVCGEKGAGELSHEGIRAGIRDGLKRAWGIGQAGPFGDL